MKLIERRRYLEELESARGAPDIKVVTGIRRSGKSTLLASYCDKVRASNPESNIIRVDFNLLSSEPLRKYHALHDHIVERRVPGVENIVVIDEVQMCEGFELAVNSLHATGEYDIYLTGSNAFLLGSDLATLFTGRTLPIAVYPFSLEEFMDYHGLDDPHAALERYAVEGGMPGSYVYRDANRRRDYLVEVFETLVIRDICDRHGVRRSDALNRVADYLMDNVGNVTSARKTADALTSAGTKTTDKTVGQYIDYLREAFAFYRVRRYDTKGKRYLSSGNKLYLADQGFRYALLGTREMDYGHAYENMVAIELLRRGYEIYAGMLYDKEIDFVATKGNEKLFIQVSDNVSMPETLERECAPLLSMPDSYPKLLLANTGHGASTYRGIEIFDLARWLADDQG